MHCGLAPSGSILAQVQSQELCSQSQAELWFSQLLLTLALLHSSIIIHQWVSMEAWGLQSGSWGQSSSRQRGLCRL